MLPYTTGALLRKPKDYQDKPMQELVIENGELTSIFSNVVEDIFRKFDLFIGRELSYDEFKILY